MKNKISILVHAYETDFYGVVSNTRYPEYLERGRYALLHAVGLPVEKTWQEEGVMALVRRVEIDYITFARHEELLELETWVDEWRGASAVVHHVLTRVSDGATIIKARQTMAFINRNSKATRAPKSYLEKLSQTNASDD
jgi:acyl-CoA thioester hydrolase